MFDANTSDTKTGALATVLSAAGPLVGVVLGYWLAVLGHDRERRVRARAAAAVLQREIRRLRCAVTDRAPATVSPELAAVGLELHPWTQELVYQLAARNPDVAFQVMQVPDVLAAFQAALTPPADVRGTIFSQQVRERDYEVFAGQPDANEAEYRTQIRLAREALPDLRTRLEICLTIYDPQYESGVEFFRALERRLAQEAKASRWPLARMRSKLRTTRTPQTTPPAAVLTAGDLSTPDPPPRL